MTVPAPPPPPFNAPASTTMQRLAACVSSPPIHRYGSSFANPFPGGVLYDFGKNNVSDPWNAPWRYNTALTGTVPSLTSVSVTFAAAPYNVSSVIDFGPKEISFTTAARREAPFIDTTASAKFRLRSRKLA